MIGSWWIHPGLILIIGVLFSPLFKGKWKQGYLLLLPVLAFIAVLCTTQGTYWETSFLGQDITLGRADKLALCFGYIFTIMTFIGMLFGLKQKQTVHHIAGYFYAGSSIGAVFAGDFVSFLVFWEMMAFSSVFLVTCNKTGRSYKAAYRYILVHATSGVLLMAGILLHYSQTKSMAFNLMELNGWSTGLILLGFAINAGFPLLGSWLPDAYPESTISGGVFMASFTTKAAVYALARGFAGTEILIWVGAIMALYSVSYACIESDMRKLLSHHILSQVGYMVAGIGIGTAIAIDGAVAHAFTNILYKGLLFMATGSIIYMTGKRNLKDTGGLYKTMPITMILFMIGGLSLSGVPLFAGFASKPMILSSVADKHYMIPWIIMMVAAAGTFLSTTLKLPYLAFMGKDKKLKASDPPINMRLAMVITAILCVAIGIFPGLFYKLLPGGGHYHHKVYAPYSWDHVVWTVQLLLFTWLCFYIYIKKFYGKYAINLDFDWFYRKGAGLFMCFARRHVARCDDQLSVSYRDTVLRPSRWLSSMSFKFDVHVIDAIVNGFASFVIGAGQLLRRFQTGRVRDYAFGILIGVFVLLNLFFFLLWRA